MVARVVHRIYRLPLIIDRDICQEDPVVTFLDVKDDSFALLVVCIYLSDILDLGYEREAKLAEGAPHQFFTRKPTVISEPGV